MQHIIHFPFAVKQIGEKAVAVDLPTCSGPLLAEEYADWIERSIGPVATERLIDEVGDLVTTRVVLHDMRVQICPITKH